MDAVEEIVYQVEDLLSGNISAEDFADWSGLYAWNIHKRADADARDLAHLIQSVMVGFESGDLSEDDVRGELRSAIAPFVIPALTGVSSVPEQLSFDPPQLKIRPITDQFEKWSLKAESLRAA
jgi:hypothetical protein